MTAYKTLIPLFIKELGVSKAVILPCEIFSIY